MSVMDLKRKHEDDLHVDSKKAKKDVSKNRGCFTDDAIPEGVFSIGDGVFVSATTFRGHVLVHIRRYKKYGNKFYPTSEGVTLQPYWIEYVMGRKKVPQSSQELCESLRFFPKDQFQITSEDFIDFTFTRLKTVLSGEIVSKSITISATQWTEMINQHNAIACIVLDHYFSSMNFLSAYSAFIETPMQESLPVNLDTSLGTEYAKEILRNCFNALLIENGLKQPEMKDCEEIWANRVETFNSIAFAFDIRDLANKFYHGLWEDQGFLIMMHVSMYVTRSFFDNVKLDHLLREARNKFCPGNAFEYFEDCV